MSKTKSYKKNFSTIFFIILFLLIAIILYQTFYSNNKTPDGLLKVYFIDSGQSDCILIETPNGKHMLIDSGDNGDETIIRKFLNSKGVKQIEYAFFTHPHADHIGGAYEVVNEYDVLNIIMPDKAVDTATYKKLIDEASKKEITALHPELGFSIIVDDVKITVFSPISKDYGSNINEYSIVLRMDYGDTSFLFTGDAEEENELEMLNAGFDLDVDILKVGHHGSSTSSSVMFLQAVTPEYSIILCGTENKFGHPHDETLSKLNDVSSVIYRTDQNGSVTVTTDGKQITVTPEKAFDESAFYIPNIKFYKISGRFSPALFFYDNYDFK